jgi:hypothetical protein
MPAIPNVTCDYCSKPINDPDLQTDPTLMRLHLINATLARYVPADPNAGTPGQVVGRQAAEHYFCGVPHLQAWLSAAVS